MSVGEGLDPVEFLQTAGAAAKACAGLPPGEQAKRLAADGLLGVMAPESVGGLGLGLPFAAAVVEAASAGLLAFPLVETLLLGKFLPAEEAAAVVSGEMVATVAWAGVAGGVVGRAPYLGGADRVLVRAEGGGVLVPVERGALAEVPGLDLEEGGAEMATGAAGPGVVGSMVDWGALEMDGLVLRTAAMLGAAAAAMELAVAHATPRKQFGRALVAFQAVRHALARQRLAVEGMRGCLVRAMGEGNALDPFVRRTAFLFAAERAPAVAEGALQLHGGMGFTWDISVHRYLRRIRQWEAEGAAGSVRGAVGRELVEERGYDWGDAA